MSDQDSKFIFARRMARVLTADDLEQIGGGDGGSTYSGPPVYAQDWDNPDVVSIPGRD